MATYTMNHCSTCKLKLCNSCNNLSVSITPEIFVKCSMCKYETCSDMLGCKHPFFFEKSEFMGKPDFIAMPICIYCLIKNAVYLHEYQCHDIYSFYAFAEKIGRYDGRSGKPSYLLGLGQKDMRTKIEKHYNIGYTDGTETRKYKIYYLMSHLDLYFNIDLKSIICNYI